MEPKSGVKTSELWVAVGSTLVTVVGAIVALLVAGNYFDEETGNLVQTIAIAWISLAVTLAPAYLGGKYIQSRTDVKAAASYNAGK